MAIKGLKKINKMLTCTQHRGQERPHVCMFANIDGVQEGSSTHVTHQRLSLFSDNNLWIEWKKHTFSDTKSFTFEALLLPHEVGEVITFGNMTPSKMFFILLGVIFSQLSHFSTLTLQSAVSETLIGYSHQSDISVSLLTELV